MALPRHVIEKMLQQGYSPQQITQITGGVEFQDESAQQPEQKKQRTLLGPIIGGIGGGIAGIPLGPLGIIAGGAAGSGLGAAAEQRLRGLPTDAGEIGREAAIGGVGGIAGRGIVGAGRLLTRMLGGKAAQVATQTAVKGGSIAGKTAAGAFNVSKPVARTLGLKPGEIMDDILRYKVKPTTETVEAVTGADGAISKIVRNAAGGIRTGTQKGVGAITGGVDISDASRAMEAMIDTSSLDSKAAKEVTNRIARLMGPTLDKMNPQDALGKMRQLEAIGQSFRKRATGLAADPVNREISNIYFAVAREMEDALMKAAGNVGIQAAKTPQLMAQLAELSPQLADDVAKATTLRELRSISRPFVGLGKMIGENELAAISPMRGMGRGVAGEVLDATGLGPALSGAAEAGRVPATMLTARGVGAVEKVARGASGALGGATTADQILRQLLGQPGARLIEGQFTGGEQPDQLGQFGGDQFGADEFGADQFGAEQAQAQPRLSPDQIQQLMIIDLMESGGKNINAIKAIAELSESMGGAGLSADQKKESAKLDSVEANITQLLQQFERAGSGSGIFGGLRQQAGRVPGLQSEVRVYEGLRQSLIAPLARAISGEVGVLTDKDVKRAEGLLPKVSDTPAEARRRIENLRGVIARRRSIMLRSPDGSSSEEPGTEDLALLQQLGLL